MSTESDLDLVLGQGRLTALFQPIVACREAAIYGYEALIRGPSDSPLHSPLNLFDAASRANRLAELDLLCRRVIVRQFARLSLPGRLFVNVTPAVVVDNDFRNGETARFLKEVGLPPERVVIELTEQFPIHDYEVMRAAVAHYRSMGFSIAVDDLGAGYASLRHWAELRPDFVKLDRHFSQGVDADNSKRQFIRSILDLSKHLGCRVIAEGIETLEEYRTLWSMGLELGQGYYFARPAALPPRVIGNLLPASGGAGDGRVRLGETVSSLVLPVPPVPPQLPGEEVASLFHHTPELRTLAVVDNGRPLGLVRRAAFMNLFAGHYGRALYGKRPILQIASRDFVVADTDMPVEALSQQITGAHDLAGDEDFVIVDAQGKYLGIGTIMGLLRRITELQIRNARYANPLTGLPGNVPINERVEELLIGERAFALAYCDLDNFKAFNDCYGYSRGDDVIACLARLLVDHADPRLDFVGHVGGDDFLMIFQSENWRDRCQAVLDAFEAQAPWFYEPADRQAGGIATEDRQGKATFFPIMTVSIAAVPVRTGTFNTRHDVAAAISEIKDLAKRMPGNSLFVDRREHAAETVPAGRSA